MGSMRTTKSSLAMKQRKGRNMRIFLITFCLVMATFVMSGPTEQLSLNTLSLNEMTAKTTALYTPEISDSVQSDGIENQSLAVIKPSKMMEHADDVETPLPTTNQPSNTPSAQGSSLLTTLRDQTIERSEAASVKTEAAADTTPAMKTNHEPSHHKFDLINTSLTRGSPPSRPRVFLGIWIRLGIDKDSTRGAGVNAKIETRRERIHRHTYLEMDYRYKSNNTVCSYKQLLTKYTSRFNPNECRLVYVYFRMEPKRLRPIQVYIKVDKKKKKHRANPNVAIPAWMNWAQEAQQNDREYIGDIDYFAVTTTEALILPTRFWNENEILNTASKTSTIGFLPKPNCTTDDIVPSKNATYAMTCLDPNFVCLSKDLASLAAKAINQTQGDLITTPPVDHLYHTLQEQIENSTSAFGSEEIRVVPMKGVASTPLPIDGVRVWTEYVKSYFDFTDPAEEARVLELLGTNVTTFQGQPRILVGILTTMSNKERDRRQALRETYFQHFANSATPHRICSVQQLLQKEVREEDCQFAYIFVVAANPDGAYTYTRSNIDGYVVPNITDPEPDVLYLNIKENMNDGKSDTWFRYAALLTNTIYFDYIGKFDTDTLVYPPEFFSFMATWPTFPNNVRVYGGRYIVWGRHPKAYGHTYMAGHLYWMSPDLANFVGFSRLVDRDMLCSDMEDMTTGSYVNMMPKLIHHIELDESVAIHEPKLKKPMVYRQAYADYLNKTQESSER